MPQNKNSLFRYICIDIRLKKPKAPTLDELTMFCSENIGDLVKSETVSKETIKKDIQHLVKSFGAPIVYDKEIKAYKYAIDNYKLFQLSETAISDLLNFIKLKSITESDVNFSDKIQFETETNPTDFATVLLIYKAIFKQYKMEFYYSKNKDKTRNKTIFEPYLLKENRNSWYLLGKKKGSKGIRIFALSRIHKIAILENEKFSLDTSFDAKQFFKYSIGITAQYAEPVKVILKFKPIQKLYLLEKPLHLSQQTIKDDETEFTIQLEVEPTYELKANILSYGDNVKVISPQSLINDLKQILENTLKSYS